MTRAILLFGSLLSLGTSSLWPTITVRTRQAMFKTQQEAEVAAPSSAGKAPTAGLMWMQVKSMVWLSKASTDPWPTASTVQP